jgi:hypothetical protein
MAPSAFIAFVSSRRLRDDSSARQLAVGLLEADRLNWLRARRAEGAGARLGPRTFEPANRVVAKPHSLQTSRDFRGGAMGSHGSAAPQAPRNPGRASSKTRAKLALGSEARELLWGELRACAPT